MEKNMTTIKIDDELINEVHR